MKFRFIIFILAVISIAILGTALFYSFLIESERRDLVDMRLQTYFERLREIDFTDKSIEELNDIQELSRDLKDSGLVWIWKRGSFRTSGGDKIFADRIELICKKTGYSYDVVDNTYIRCLRKSATKKEPEIIVASIMVRGTEPFFVSYKFFVYILAALLLGLGLSWLIFKYFMQPFVELQKHAFELLNELKTMSVSDFKKSKLLIKKNRSKNVVSDEYNRIIDNLYSFLDNISDLASEFNSRSFRLSHEMKTPLAIMMNQITEIQDRYRDNPEAAHEFMELHQKMRELVLLLNRYDLYNESQLGPHISENLYSLDLNEICENLCREINKIYPARVEFFKSKDQLRLIADQIDLEHLLQNLIVNALKYSEGNVQVILGNKTVIICDQGPGIPSEVIENLGAPFNKGTDRISKSGYGLGLSIVMAIASRYSWVVQFENSSIGLRVSIDLSAS